MPDDYILRSESPFRNDMFSIVWQAFKRLFPNKDCICEWVPEIRESEDGNPVYGLTDFGDDGSVWVFVLADISVKDAIEIFAHELAHVAVGADEDHGEAWKKAFDAIFEEYNRIQTERYGKEGEQNAE